MAVAFSLTIHIITAKVVVKLLAVVLLFLLDMSEGVAKNGTCKLENAGVVNA